MDDDSWNTPSSSVSKRCQSAFQTRSDVFMAFEDVDVDDDILEEFPCPFCNYHCDIIGLCCHIDDVHPDELRNGSKSKSHKNGAHSTRTFLRKELQERNLQSLLGGSSRIVSSSNAAADPLLSSFMLPMADDIVIAESQSLAGISSINKGKEDTALKRQVKPSPLSSKDQEERARRSHFVHELLLSSFFDDKL
ncbi:protein DEHYDRATION-INDUCED 19 homolog 3-like isoform X1 [Amaranthus tricolor]|uniref:protein DEHYDRATION-INDUCED 19 homolog 3-like isoform X1 n=1 Tax=Amaranthus tricolor TaxID=29722 RepID=UPI00258EB0DA|nr:protein DEHYDRATION-INDUCED 19 homolog 3-like isoform X1 [Amaranthus tricolor]